MNTGKEGEEENEEGQEEERREREKIIISTYYCFKERRGALLCK